MGKTASRSRRRAKSPGIMRRARSAEGPLEFMPSARIAYRYRYRFLEWLLDGHVFFREALSNVFPKAIRRELVVNERIAEVPFALRALDLPRGARIVDIGSRWSAVPLELVSLGYQVVATDIGPFPFQGAGFDYVLADMRKPPFKPGSFDGASIISTLEHVGVGFYDSRVDSDDDIAMMEAMHRIVKPGGVVVLTVPYGVAAMGRVQRSYDRVRLERITQRWILDEALYYIKRGVAWLEANEGEVADLYSANQTRAVAMVRLIRP